VVETRKAEARGLVKRPLPWPARAARKCRARERGPSPRRPRRVRVAGVRGIILPRVASAAESRRRWSK